MGSLPWRRPDRNHRFPERLDRPALCVAGRSELLQVAKGTFDRLQLWTFQRNTRARRLYEARGFVLVEETDDASNEENEPDARYLWTRG
jgi:hypothetical protein